MFTTSQSTTWQVTKGRVQIETTDISENFPLILFAGLKVLVFQKEEWEVRQ